MAGIRWGPFTDHEKALAEKALQHLGQNEHWRIEWRPIDETVIEDYHFGANGLCNRSSLVVTVDDSYMMPTEQFFQVLMHEIGHAYDGALMNWNNTEPGPRGDRYLSGITSAAEARSKVEKDYADLPTAGDADYAEVMTVEQFNAFAATVSSDFSSEQWAEYNSIMFRWVSLHMAADPSIGARLEALARYPMPTGATQNDTR